MFRRAAKSDVGERGSVPILYAASKLMGVYSLFLRVSMAVYRLMM